jgi:hypothetical protein
MTAWDVEPGTWTLRQASGPDPDALPGQGTAPRSVELERSGGFDVTFAPGVATVLESRLVTRGTPYWSRPDLGIGERDVKLDGRRLTVTVHSLGAVGAPASRLVLRDRAGSILATARVPPLEAPMDLRPSLATVAIEVGPGVREITQMNNTVAVPAGVAPPAASRRVEGVR